MNSLKTVAGQRNLSWIQKAVWICTAWGWCFTTFTPFISWRPTLCHFLQLLSPALFRVAPLLSKIRDCCSEPLVLCGLGLTWSGACWAVSQSTAWNDSATLSHFQHWSNSFSPCLGPAAGWAYGWHIAQGYAWGLASLLCRPWLPGEAGGGRKQQLVAVRIVRPHMFSKILSIHSNYLNVYFKNGF